MSVPFEIDPESISAARDITSALRYYTSEEESRMEPEEYQLWGGGTTVVLDRPGMAQKPGKARAIFQEIAGKVAEDVDLKDVAEDVGAYDELQRTAATSHISLPFINIADRYADEVRLPCLLEPKEVQRLLAPKKEIDLIGVEKRMRGFLSKFFAHDQIGFAPREDV